MFKDYDFLPQEEISHTPSFAITDMSKIFDHLSRNNWEIPDGIRELDYGQEENVQTRIDEIFPKFINHIQYAKEGEKVIIRVRETGILSGSSNNIIHYKYLRFNLWENFEGKTEDFSSDINRIQNCLRMYLSSDVQNEVAKGLDVEQFLASEQDLEFTRDFLRSVFKSVQREMIELNLYEEENS